jgi:hypothetical protein
VERAGIHGHRLSRRLLPEVSPVSEFVPGLCARALLQSIAQSARVRRREVPAQRVPAAQRDLNGMMRLPARLTAKLAKARIAQIVDSAPARSLIHCVDAAEVLHPGSAAPVSHEKMQRLIENPAPLIWIGGSEPLVHPGIGHFVRVIAQSDHFVFLETNGTFLRGRIHEFQPLPGLFLTVRLDSLQAPEVQLVVEGLRAAHLSAFFTIVHSQVRKDSGLAQLAPLRSFLAEQDVDGWLITSGSVDQAIAREAAAGRNLIPSWFWRRFSRLVENELLARIQDLESRGISRVESPPAEECEEGMRVA